MPGIVGLITKAGRDRAEPQLHRMVEALRHESFYETGTWIDESQGLYVGWVARKDSFPGSSPLENERGDKVLVFSGKNFPILRPRPVAIITAIRSAIGRAHIWSVLRRVASRFLPA